jgi:hypothetical protein
MFALLDTALTFLEQLTGLAIEFQGGKMHLSRRTKVQGTRYSLKK